MATRGAPIGNKNAIGGNQRLWDAALRRAIAQDSSDRLRKAAEQLLDQGAAGEQWAIKELGDRLDGKAMQAIIGAGDNGEHLVDIIAAERPQLTKDEWLAAHGLATPTRPAE